MLPNPNKTITENRIKIIYSCIWNKKQVRISKKKKKKKKTAIKHYKGVGLNGQFNCRNLLMETINSGQFNDSLFS